MVEKEIKNMGKITFGKFYSTTKIKIKNLNESPIKNSIEADRLNEKEMCLFISNEYIYSL